MLTSSSRVVHYDLTYPFDTDYVINFKFWSSVQIHAVLSFDDGTEDLPLVLSTDYTLSAPGDTGTLTKVSDWNHAAVRLYHFFAEGKPQARAATLLLRLLIFFRSKKWFENLLQIICFNSAAAVADFYLDLLEALRSFDG